MTRKTHHQKSPDDRTTFFSEFRSPPASMLRVKQIAPVSTQYAGDASPGPIDGVHIVTHKNRWSRVALKFHDIEPGAWCEFSFQISWHPDEQARNIHDFAALGISFLASDGSDIDFTHVPGLARAQIDPYSDYIPGPAYLERSADHAGSSRVRFCFLAPAPARQLLIAVRSWRNTHAFQINSVVLRQFAQPDSADPASADETTTPSQAEIDASLRVPYNWKTLQSEPVWFRYALVQGRPLSVRGQMLVTNAEHEGGLARVVFRDAEGELISPPYPDTLMVPAIGAFINIPASTQARRFTLDLAPPAHAATVELGFQAKRYDAPLQLIVPLEVSLPDELLLENIWSEEVPGATGFLELLAKQLHLAPGNKSSAQSDLLNQLLDREALVSPLLIHRRLRVLQRGERSQAASDHLRLGAFPTWPLPSDPNWDEDPFRSPSWRLEFQSLSWLLDLAGSENSDSLAHALRLALSWSASNQCGQPADGLSVHPLPLAARAEALLELLSKSLKSEAKVAPGTLLALLGEVVRHCFALSQIISQNVFSHSVYQLHAASALFVLARAIPRVPLSSHWSSIALAHLRDGFDELIGPDGALNEPSQHYRLEIISLGLILTAVLEYVPEAQEFRQTITSRLQTAILTAIALTDPAGMLPPFGDAPPGLHHASWLKRLIATYGQGLASNRSIKKALSYPRGPRTFALPNTGVIVARHYEPGQEWGYFAAAISEQRARHGHDDCTSFVYSSGGVRWITDPGGAREFETGPVRQYIAASRAHNVAIPDGREQTAGVAWLRSTTVLGGVNIFEVVSTVNGPDYHHRRIFACARDLDAIAVFDHFETSDRPISVAGLLHFEPEVTTTLFNPQLIMGFRDQKKLRITPRAIIGRLAGVEIVHGSNERPSSVQGFVSRRPGTLEPAGALRYALAGQRSVCGGVIMAASEESLKAITRILETPKLDDLLKRSSED
ncbi:heparinase II/III domain-containing protein [Microvirga alba]|uniref:Heparinase II/III family protein n=1 Tax=Microvirga alba TaxID=2791025 RepID=A0A931BZF7_9HYPH|nr:heparinase II/III family protein [Microvirga alba]MBF9235637.1 heparinase II/III family protein [Microvirga alba]